MLMVADNGAIVGLWFIGQKYFGIYGTSVLPTSAECPVCHPCGVLAELSSWLDAYFSGKRPTVMPKLRPAGTKFRLSVWQELLNIPYGSVLTYGQLAQRLARKHNLPRMSAQAVGGAVSRNPISILIPCHRVVGSDYRPCQNEASNHASIDVPQSTFQHVIPRGLTGYAGGLWRKARLLAMEQSI